MIALKDIPSDEYSECDSCGDEAAVSIGRKVCLCIDCAHELGEALIDL